MITIKQSCRSFYIGDSETNPLAEIVFNYKGENIVTIDRTFVSESMRGQNIASQLLQRLVEWAREENIKIIPVCEYAKKKMENNNDYKDVLLPKCTTNIDWI